MRREIARIWSAARTHARWLASPGLAWFTVAAFAAALTYAFWWPISEARIAQAGTLLQLAGTLMGFRALSSTRKLFKMPSLTEEARAFIGRRPLNRTMPLEAVGFGMSVSSADGSVWSVMGSDLDAIARLDAMAANIQQLRKEVGEARVEHRTAVATLRTDMESKTRAIEEILSGTSLTLRKSQTDGLWAAWVALAMLLVGTVLASLPNWAVATPQLTGAGKTSTELLVVPDVYSIPPAVPDRRGTERHPLVVTKPPDELRREEIADSQHATNELRTTIATIVLAMFTVTLTFTNIWLIRDARRVSDRQAADTRRSIDEAKRSADAMGEVAEATKNNAILMSGLLSKQMRAYVQVNIGRSTAQRGDDTLFGSWPEILNVGLTPAKRISYRIMADILDPSAIGPDFAYPEPERVFTNDATLNPRQVFELQTTVNRRFELPEVEEISKGITKRLFVWGAVTYDDVFGGRNETRFSHNFIFYDQTNPDTGKVEYKVRSYYSGGHNDAT